MLRSASIAHRIPGRIRIRIPSAKADAEFLEQARAAVASLPGVLEVSCNPLTGSILILHSPDSELEIEGSLTGGNGSTLPFVLETATSKPPAVPPRRRRRKAPRQSYLATAVAETVTEIDDIVREATGNALDLKVLLPLVAGGLGLTMLGKPRRTPAWLTLLMFAFSSFISLHGKEIAEEIDSSSAAND
ncbi:MAG: HMA2 domain-containing protein [Candidatus Binataceae bacterium]